MTTTIYCKFIASPEATEYHGSVFFTWEGLIVRESFSTYALMMPLANSVETAHGKVHESFPNVHIYAEKVFFIIGVTLPESSEYEGSVTPPNTEHVEAGMAWQKLVWAFENRPGIGGGAA